MESDIDAMTPQIRPHPSRDGVQVLDPIQDSEFTLLTPEPVSVSECETDQFYFPVDVAAVVETNSVETQYIIGGWIRDTEGTAVAEISEEESQRTPPGEYIIELNVTQAKIKIAVKGSVEVETYDGRTRITVIDAENIRLGARSVHEQPAGTVTTTDKPKDVMAALSTLGSGLKTTSCERSFPTLRGHPPLIERGKELSIPDWITVPDTDIEIEVPPEFEYIYPLTTLTYYLGARLRPGANPKLIAGDWEYRLDRENGFEETVARTLKQLFLLDCVTRTEGHYQVELSERRQIEETVSLDFEQLYQEPITEQVRQYLGVDFDDLAEAMPRWKLTTDVRSEIDNVSALPFLADELSVIRCPESADIDNRGPADVANQVQEMLRNRPDTLIRGSESQTVRAGSSSTSSNSEIFRPSDANSIEQAYVGDGIPVGASKMTVDSYYRRLEYEPSTNPQIRVAVVCNDEEMAEENVVSEIYGTRDWIEFDISFDEQLTAAELSKLLRTEIDFLHYIGHVDDEGIRCTDGYLDTRELTEVNVSAFLLNACDSYEQGFALVEKGAMAGIATVTDVINEAATSVGQSAARLLNQGFSLASTVSIIKEFEQIGHHYIVVGDSSMSVVQNESGTPYHSKVQEIDNQRFDLTLYGYPRLDTPLGSLFKPHLPNYELYHLNSGSILSTEVSKDDLNEFLEKQQTPVISDEELFWSLSFESDT